MSTVTLCMIVCDEEEHIGTCLSTAKPYVDEIIVVDTGSRDQTAAIAEQMGAQVYRQKWNDHFAEARNYALKRAHGDWILVLDADERLEPIDPEYFENLLANHAAAGFYVTVRHYDSARTDDYETDTICRLFRNLPGISYHGRIHEDIGMSISIHFPKMTINNSTLVVSHLGYLRQLIQSKNKVARNRKLLEQAVLEESDTLYYRYAIGVESFLQEHYREAAELLSPLLPQVPPSAGYASDLAYKLCFAYWRSGQYAEALKAAETGLLRVPTHADLQELHGVLLLEERRIEEAFHRFKSIAKSTAYSDARQHERLDYWLGLVNQRLGNWNEALRHLERSLHTESYHQQALPRWLNLALLVLPIEKVVSDLQAAIPGSHRTSILKLICPLVMKWGMSDRLLPFLDTTVETENNLDRELAFYRAIMTAQAGNPDIAFEIMQQLVRETPERHIILYVWALQNFHETRPELTALADKLLRSEKMNEDHKALLEQAAFAMLMVRSWEGFLFIWQHWCQLLLNDEPSVPVAWRSAIYRSPDHVRKIIWQKLFSETGKGRIGDRIFTAQLAHVIGNKEESLLLFNKVKEDYPQLLEPRIGLYGVLHNSDEYACLLFLAES
ncbi:glycosyltransferase [Paenibacillus sp. SI8]|uniref:glycosyltransferase n=1 Tax=unclassified Paenibacillus TaxID=185978 RepID=UPI003465F591